MVSLIQLVQDINTNPIDVAINIVNLAYLVKPDEFDKTFGFDVFTLLWWMPEDFYDDFI